MKYQLVLALVVLAFSPAILARSRRVQQISPNGNANVLVDAVVAKAVDMIKAKNLDPYVFPEQVLIGFVDLDAALSGLTSIHRCSNASLDFNAGKAELKTSFELDNFEGDVALSIPKIGVDFGAELTIGVCRVYVEAEGSLGATGELNAMSLEITKFDVQLIASVEVQVVGLPAWLDFIIDGVADAIGNAFGTQIGKLLDNELKTVLNDVLKNFEPGQVEALLKSKMHPPTPAKHALHYVKPVKQH